MSMSLLINFLCTFCLCCCARTEAGIDPSVLFSMFMGGGGMVHMHCIVSLLDFRACAVCSSLSLFDEICFSQGGMGGGFRQARRGGGF
jgi:hypothetical protein